MKKECTQITNIKLLIKQTCAMWWHVTSSRIWILCVWVSHIQKRNETPFATGMHFHSVFALLWLSILFNIFAYSFLQSLPLSFPLPPCLSHSLIHSLSVRVCVSLPARLPALLALYTHSLFAWYVKCEARNKPNNKNNIETKKKKQQHQQ